MKLLKVEKNKLLIFSGIFWIIAGFNVYNVARKLELCLTFKYNILLILVFFVFYIIIFKRMNKKNIERIKNLSEETSIFNMFNLKSYIIIFFMMTMGILIRKFNIVDDVFVKYFYSGLGAALFLTGVDSIEKYFKINKENK